MNEHLRRDPTVDIARGIAIVAIVVGHVLRGLAPSGIVDGGSSTFETVDRVLYLVHVPVFAFLAGLFVGKSADQTGAARYLLGRLALFLYLYLLWQTLQVSVKIATGALVNTRPVPSDLWTLWKPEGQLWFLPFLMIATTLAVALRVWRFGRLSLCGMAAIALISVLTWGIDGLFVGSRGNSLLVFFFAGTAIGYPKIRGLVATLTSARILALTLVAVALFSLLISVTVAAPPTVNDPARTLPEVFWGVNASIAGVLGILGISSLLGRAPAVRWLSFIGQRSLEVFLAHIIVASGMRIVLLSAGVEDLVLHVIAGTLAGVVLPLALWWTCRRAGFPWLFELPGLGAFKNAELAK